MLSVLAAVVLCGPLTQADLDTFHQGNPAWYCTSAVGEEVDVAKVHKRPAPADGESTGRWLKVSIENVHGSPRRVTGVWEEERMATVSVPIKYRVKICNGRRGCRMVERTRWENRRQIVRGTYRVDVTKTPGGRICCPQPQFQKEE